MCDDNDDSNDMICFGSKMPQKSKFKAKEK